MWKYNIEEKNEMPGRVIIQNMELIRTRYTKIKIIGCAVYEH